MDTEPSKRKHTGDFVSKLETPQQRFLATIVEGFLYIGARKPEDFLRHFSPIVIMTALKEDPEKRADILINGGVVTCSPKFAGRKSPQNAAEDIVIALEEAQTTPEHIVDQFHPDDRACLLDTQALWRFAMEEIEMTEGDARLSFILNTASTEGLLAPQELIQGISDQLALLPAATLAEALKIAFQHDQPFREADFLKLSTIEEIIQHVPFAIVWSKVVLPFARTYGFVPMDASEEELSTHTGSSNASESTDIDSPQEGSDDAEIIIDEPDVQVSGGPTPDIEGAATEAEGPKA